MYRPGNVVAGKYRIEHVLGQGGMGYVVAATHLDLGTPVALKFLHGHMLENQGVVDRFKREARASAQLRGENVCRVSDVGTTEDGQPFIVMELLSGQDLTTVLRERTMLSVPLTAEIVQQACLALAEAHALGIVHRDIKPGNLMLTSRPDGTMCIKVLDFGVAKAPEDVNFSLTQTSSVIGSPGYMSPEQLKSSKGADVRSDIWSLGVVMYELVAGTKPWGGESITELALKVALEPPSPLAGRVPWEFEGVVMHCLEKEAAKRYQDVADLAVALAPYAGSHGPETARAVARVLRGANTPMPMAPQPSIPMTPTPAPAMAPAPSQPTTLRGASGVVAQSHSQVSAAKKNWKTPVIIGGGAVVGVALALLILGGHHKAKPAAASSDRVEMQTPTPIAPTPTAGAPAPTDTAAKDAADKLAADKAAKAAAAKDAADKLAADKAAKAAAAKDAADKLAADKAAAKEAKAEAAKQAAAEKAAKAEAAKQAAADKAAAAKEAKAEAAKQAAANAHTASASTKTTSTKTASSKTASSKTTKTTKPKDVGDSRE